MNGPTTEAGRRLLAGMPWTTDRERESWERLILAIEAEAVAACAAKARRDEHDLAVLLAAEFDGPRRQISVMREDRTAEVAAALAEVGLPLTASVADLIRHHRNNEAAANGGWKLAYDALREQTAASSRKDGPLRG